LRGGLKVAAVKAPGFGDRRKAMLAERPEKKSPAGGPPGGMGGMGGMGDMDF
jgi:hypothetical protein